MHLPYDARNGDLLLRIRPSSLYEMGWEVLLRLTPRPLSSRSWRVCNMKGALNATIAASMIELTRPRSTDRFLNLMCGSGTLLIERLHRCRVSHIVGCDIDADALAAAQENIQAANIHASIQLLQADAASLPFPDGSFDQICADLPWGQLTGSRKENVSLYPNVLREAARITMPGARLVLLTHDISTFERAREDYVQIWNLKEMISVFQGGLHPRIYLFERIPFSQLSFADLEDDW